MALQNKKMAEEITFLREQINQKNFIVRNLFTLNYRTVKRVIQTQPCRGSLKKMCSENMQQIYRRAPMPKCDFSKVAKQLY